MAATLVNIYLNDNLLAQLSRGWLGDPDVMPLPSRESYQAAVEALVRNASLNPYKLAPICQFLFYNMFNLLHLRAKLSLEGSVQRGSPAL